MTCKPQHDLPTRAPVRRDSKAFKSRCLRVSLLAQGLLLLWIGVQVLAAAPRLHHVLHADAASPGHECVLTGVAAGFIEAPASSEGPLRIVEWGSAPRVWSTEQQPAPRLLTKPCCPRPPPPPSPMHADAGS
jgi:hypothetical protein